MEHIRNIIESRKATLFGIRSEKGSREWSMFNVVRNDHIGAYRVATPRKASEPRYPNIVRITRLPRHFRPLPAH